MLEHLPLGSPVSIPCQICCLGRVGVPVGLEQEWQQQSQGLQQGLTYPEWHFHAESRQVRVWPHASCRTNIRKCCQRL